jgi:hypothetical protein
VATNPIQTVFIQREDPPVTGGDWQFEDGTMDQGDSLTLRSMFTTNDIGGVEKPAEMNFQHRFNGDTWFEYDDVKVAVKDTWYEKEFYAGAVGTYELRTQCVHETGTYYSAIITMTVVLPEEKIPAVQRRPFLTNPTDVTVLGTVTAKIPGAEPTHRINLNYELTAFESNAGGFVLEKNGDAAKRKIMLSQVSNPVLMIFQCAASFTVDIPEGGSTALDCDHEVVLGFPSTTNVTSIAVTMISSTTAVPFNWYIAAVSS